MDNPVMSDRPCYYSLMFKITPIFTKDMSSFGFLILTAIMLKLRGCLGFGYP